VARNRELTWSGSGLLMDQRSLDADTVSRQGPPHALGAVINCVNAVDLATQGQQMITTIRYTICENPSDHPGKFIVRRWRVADEGSAADLRPMFIGETLEEVREVVRAIMPRGVCLGRAQHDDASVIETWTL
jgi:hypothetical protein